MQKMLQQVMTKPNHDGLEFGHSSGKINLSDKSANFSFIY